jgi:hypothetical protein
MWVEERMLGDRCSGSHEHHQVTRNLCKCELKGAEKKEQDLQLKRLHYMDDRISPVDAGNPCINIPGKHLP